MFDGCGYPLIELYQVSARITDGSHFSPKPREHGHLIANVKDMRTGAIDFSTCTRISPADYLELKATGCTVKKGNVLLSKDGTVGRVVVYKQDNEIGALSSICIIEPSDRLDAGFLGHALQSEGCTRQYDNFMSGSALRRLVLRDIRSIQVPLPESQHQGAIARVLDTIDEAIAAAEAQLTKQEKIKQGLLQDLLTRGIDETGQIRPHWEDRPDLYQMTDLGVIPKDWDIQSLDSLSSLITSGSRNWADFYSNVGALFIRIGNLTRENINLRFDSIVYVDLSSNNEGQRTRLSHGDILISITADLGIVAVIPDDIGEAYINQHIALVRLNSSNVNSRFVGYFLASETVQNYITKLNDVGAKAGLNLSAIRGLLTVVPGIEEQDLIVDNLDEAVNQALDSKFEIRKLQKIKTGLMQDLLTGQRRVTPELIRQVETLASNA